MADALLASLLLGQKRRADPLEARRKYGESLMQQGGSTAPLGSGNPLEGIARALQGGIGGWFAGQADIKQEERGKKNVDTLMAMANAKDAASMADIAKGLDGDTDLIAPLAAQLVAQRQKQFQDEARGNQFAGAYGVAPPSQTAAPVALPQGGGGGVAQPGYTAANAPGSVNAQAIAGIESQGQPNNGYGAVGPQTAQGRAYGKYQVLESNIVPWTQEILGKAMTPQEFIASPQAQDAVFEGKFGQYVTKYGSPQAASRAWFAGENGMNNPDAKDVNGVSVAQYERKFDQTLNPAGGSTGGFAPPDVARSTAAPGQPGPIAQAPAQGDTQPVAPPSAASGPPDIPRPAPTADQIAKYRNLIATGQITGAQAVEALDKEVTQQWQMDKTRALEVWKDQQQSKRQNEKAAIDLGQKAPMEMISKRVDNYENKIRPAAVAAVNDINALHSVRQALDAGAFTGSGAEVKTWLAKLGEQFGIPSDQAVNTQVLGAVLAKRTLAAAGGTLGTGFSNADRDFTEKASGGTITLDEAGIRRLADIAEREARTRIKQHDEEAARVQRLPGIGQLGADQFAIPQAPTYAEWSKANAPPRAPAPGAPAPAAPQGGGDILAQARDAIARGAPREKVIEKMRSMGISPDGL